MIKFLTDKTISLIRYGKGSMVELSPQIESALIQEGAAEKLNVVNKPIKTVKPVEVLASSGISVPCTLIDADEILASFLIPAATLGVNSILQIEPLWVFSNSGGIKTLKVRIGNAMIYAAARTTSVREAPLIVLMNRNSLASQILPYDGVYEIAGINMPTTHSINFQNDQIVHLTGRRTSNEDMVVLEYFRILHFVGD